MSVKVEDLITLDEVSKTIGMPRHKIARRIKSMGIQTYKAPLDMRVMMMPRTDVSRLEEFTRWKPRNHKTA